MEKCMSACNVMSHTHCIALNMTIEILIQFMNVHCLDADQYILVPACK